MTRSLVPVAAAVLAAATAGAPAQAQEWQTARERFAFAGHRLLIQVEVESPGTLRVIRGAPGSVRVAGRAERGFTAAGLAEDDHLTLTAAGPGPVDYLVSVPDNVWVEVRLPDGVFGESVGSYDSSRTFEWRRRGTPPEAVAGSPGVDAAPRAEATPPVAAGPPASAGTGVGPEPLFTTYTDAVAPSVVALPDLSVIRSVTVRVEGHRFRVVAGRPLAVRQGSPDELVIRPAGPPMDLVIAVPAGTRAFQLRAGAAIALLVDDGRVTPLCSPVTRQWLSHDRVWLTFNPVEGTLRCDATPAERHEG
jgi:hypothetical protein